MGESGATKEAVLKVVEMATDREFLRWKDEMRELVTDLTCREKSARELAQKAWSDSSEQRLNGKADAYDHAAEMLEAAIKRMEQP